MRKVCWHLAVVVCAVGVWAAALDAQAGPKSPRTTATGIVDGVHIAIEYGAPFKRGRVIWGGLRPWDEWWMPGADQATQITTSGPLMLDKLLVPAGDHTVYTLPGEQKFLLIINKQLGQFHTQYHPNMDLGRVPMSLRMLAEPVEQMTFAIDADPAGGGRLELIWDDREYSVAIGAPKH
jgi:hypothetical protein